LGSAALNLCYLAEGCLDCYWATSVKIWDVAAGYLIAERAGVVFSSIDGSAFQLIRPLLLASSTAHLQAQMLDCLHRRL
jgi:myo-inositol-1(or 4)-monophosphatase